MNDDLISREALKKQLKAKIDLDQDDEFTIGYNIGISACVELIDNATTVEYTFEEAFQKTVCEQKLYCPSRPQGEWYYNCQNGWHCSLCHKTVKFMPTIMGKANFDFCPNCGANMKQD